MAGERGHHSRHRPRWSRGVPSSGARRSWICFAAPGTGSWRFGSHSSSACSARRGLGRRGFAASSLALVDEQGGRVVRRKVAALRGEAPATAALAPDDSEPCRNPRDGLLPTRPRRSSGAGSRRLIDVGGPAEHAGAYLPARRASPRRPSTSARCSSISARDFVEAIARERPTLFVFEDVHWADPSLLDLIEWMAAHVREVPAMFLTLARGELLDARPSWGGGDPAPYRRLSRATAAGDGSRAGPPAASRCFTSPRPPPSGSSRPPEATRCSSRSWPRRWRRERRSPLRSCRWRSGRSSLPASMPFPRRSDA